MKDSFINQAVCNQELERAEICQQDLENERAHMLIRCSSTRQVFVYKLQNTNKKPIVLYFEVLLVGVRSTARGKTDVGVSQDSF